MANNPAQSEHIHERARTIRADAIRDYRDVANRATPEQWQSGLRWYVDANDHAQAIAETLRERGITNASTRLGAAILSAFSPNEPWSRNVRRAALWSAGTDPGGLTMHTNAAANVLASFNAGDDPVSGLGGPKTYAFAHNIDGDWTHATIDKHMIEAAKLHPKTISLVGVYSALADACKTVAAEFNITPAELQAIIWIVQRGSAD